MRNISRRRLLQTLSHLSVPPLLGLTQKVKAGAPEKPVFFINLQASGGWDVASFCDPKMNVAGEKIVNNWAKTSELQTAGNLRFAPIGNNQEFFNQHYQKILVINGVNARTNVHAAGRLSSLTGSDHNGSPSLSVLYAAERARHLPMPVMVGNSFETAGLLAPTQIGGNIDELIALNRASNKNHNLLPADDFELLQNWRRQSAVKQGNDSKNWQNYLAAINVDDSGFPLCLHYYETLEQGNVVANRVHNAIKFALCAFKAGLGLAFDFSIGGFDTHDKHDLRMANCLTQLTDAATAAWFFAEQLAIQDQLLLMMESEFGRTPFYNDVAGKDHWPYSSVMIMKANASWTNRVIGQTTPDCRGTPLDPKSLLPSSQGVELQPKHLHGALRRYLGIANGAYAQQFPLKEDLQYNFFG